MQVGFVGIGRMGSGMAAGGRELDWSALALIAKHDVGEQTTLVPPK
ncbi:MAG: hypothetical protein ACXWVI_06230 [Methyloceanibacter sp.]